MGFFDFFFGFNGRATRLNWWVGQAVSYALAIGGGMIAGLNLDPLQRIDLTQLTANQAMDVLRGMGPALALVWLAGLISLSVSVRRLHDRDKSGWWVYLPALPLLILPLTGMELVPITATLLLIFIISMWQLVELGCLAGTLGANDYGSEFAGRIPGLEKEIAAMQRDAALRDALLAESGGRPVFGRR